MTTKLLFQALTKYFLGVILVGTLIFLPAGTLRFFKGWLLMGILFVPMFFAGGVLMIKNPQLLKKRLSTDEKLGEQKTIVAISGVMFAVGFVTAGLDFRFDWLDLPKSITVISVMVFLLSYLLYAEVIRENAYLSRTIEIQENQKVVDTGLYGIVRHPMYTSSIFMFLSMPLILGSVYAFLIFLVYPVLIVQRIKSEEAFLERELAGYKEYKAKVKYKLVPFVW